MLCLRKYRLGFTAVIFSAAMLLTCSIAFAGSLLPQVNWKMFFIFSMLPVTLYILFMFKGGYAQKIFLATTIYLFFRLSASFIMALPILDGFHLAEELITAGIFIALYPAFKTMDGPLRKTFETLRPHIFLLMSIYPLTASTILSLWREKLRDTDSLLALFLILLAAYGAIIMLTSLNQARKRSDAENEKRILVLLEENARANYNLMQTAVENARIAKHDARHHLRTIKGMIEDGKTAEAKEYILNLDKRYVEINLPQHCENAVADAIIKYYLSAFNSEHITFDCFAVLGQSISILDTDLSCVLSNLLENAHKAVLALPQTEEKKISLKIERIQNVVIIKSANSYSPARSKAEDGKGQGLGLKSIRRICDKYNGRCLTSAENGLFCIEIFLPCD